MAHPAFPGFDQSVPANGYVWWYIDAISDDGEHALTLIAFIGSVFSPYYAWARSRRPTEALNHCALNVALYGRRGKRWSMTERPGTAVSQSPHSLHIGPSSLNWNGSFLDINIDELTVPLPTRIRGHVRVWPAAVTEHSIMLDSNGRHYWRPVAPCGHVEVEMTHPAIRWSGNAYMDSNAGSRPLEDDFVSWNWSRTRQGQNTLILYEIERRQGDPLSLALETDHDGGLTNVSPPDVLHLPGTRWRMSRSTRAEQAKVLDTLEDTPFYSRSLLDTCILGKQSTTFHESLSLDRFRSDWVRCLLPFRMPRRSG